MFEKHSNIYYKFTKYFFLLPKITVPTGNKKDDKISGKAYQMVPLFLL